MNGLTVIEQNNLVELENTIEKNLHAFYEVGFALMQIRDNKLYRVSFDTFEAYCKEKWGMSRSYAYRLIASSEIADNLSPIGNIPKVESVIRPLASLEPEQQREAYKKAIETAPEGKVTAKHIEETVKEMREEKTEVVGDVIEKIEESDAVFQLKRWWRKATKKDKKIFIEWTREE